MAKANNVPIFPDELVKSLRESRFKLAASMDPDCFAPSGDLLDTLKDKSNRERFIGGPTEKTLNMRNFPTICRRNVVRIQEQLREDGIRLGVHPICAAALSFGLSGILDNDWIMQLLQLKSIFNQCPSDLPQTISNVVDDFLSAFEVETPNKYELLNPKIPEPIFTRLSGSALRLGIHTSKLAALSLCESLSYQETALDDDRVEMRGYVEKFLSSAETRTRGARALMREFGIL